MIRDDAVDILSNLIDGQYTSVQIHDVLDSWVCYRQFYQRKKSGAKRLLSAPDDSLKKLQYYILRYILYRFPVHKNLYGFVPGVTMKDGVYTHLLNQHTRDGGMPRWILHIDLKNCFPSVKSEILQNMFEDMSAGLLYEYGVHNTDVFLEFCRIMVELTTYKGRLTQGAPTSPYLTNLVISWSGIADNLDAYCRENKLHFSIYADDIVVSSVNHEQISKRQIIKCVEANKIFRVNPKKTHLNNVRHRSHCITGIIVHTPIVGVDKCARLTLSQKKQKFYRGRIWYATRFLQQGYEPSIQNDGISVEQVRGYIAWIRHVCGGHIPSSLQKPISYFEKITATLNDI
ncbi:MAG: reverse transcriptase family protein [Candidatus Moraniibacteriota bacterium]|jgi:reverse transcriptase-like protein